MCRRCRGYLSAPGKFWGREVHAALRRVQPFGEFHGGLARLMGQNIPCRRGHPLLDSNEDEFLKVAGKRFVLFQQGVVNEAYSRIIGNHHAPET